MSATGTKVETDHNQGRNPSNARLTVSDLLCFYLFKICCTVVKSYNGKLIAWREGLRTCLCTPWSDEPRMKLQAGEIVLVSRVRKYVSFG